jgi:LytS/YehU family sensor histidine kinase
MKKIAAASTFAVCLFLSAVALAQPEAAQPDLTQVLAAAFAIIGTWKGGGALVGMIAVVNVLTNATKLSILDGIMSKWWWLRPTVSLGLGLVGGILTSVAAGTPIAASILAGLVAGLASTGFHELMTQVNARVKAERATGAAIVAIVATGDVAKISDMKVKLDAITVIKDEKERLVALAAWANANPI